MTPKTQKADRQCKWYNVQTNADDRYKKISQTASYQNVNYISTYTTMSLDYVMAR